MAAGLHARFLRRPRAKSRKPAKPSEPQNQPTKIPPPSPPSPFIFVLCDCAVKMVCHSPSHSQGAQRNIAVTVGMGIFVIFGPAGLTSLIGIGTKTSLLQIAASDLLHSNCNPSFWSYAVLC